MRTPRTKTVAASPRPRIAKEQIPPHAFLPMTVRTPSRVFSVALESCARRCLCFVQRPPHVGLLRTRKNHAPLTHAVARWLGAG